MWQTFLGTVVNPMHTFQALGQGKRAACPGALVLLFVSFISTLILAVFIQKNYVAAAPSRAWTASWRTIPMADLVSSPTILLNDSSDRLTVNSGFTSDWKVRRFRECVWTHKFGDGCAVCDDHDACRIWGRTVDVHRCACA